MLRIKAANPAARLCPTYDIDLAWHTHQSRPHTYKQETTALLGTHYDHDDSINDRAPDSDLNKMQADTVRLWHLYGLSFFSTGGMWRGPPPGSNAGPRSSAMPLSADLLVTFSKH